MDARYGHIHMTKRDITRVMETVQSEVQISDIGIRWFWYFPIYKNKNLKLTVRIVLPNTKHLKVTAWYYVGIILQYKGNVCLSCISGTDVTLIVIGTMGNSSYTMNVKVLSQSNLQLYNTNESWNEADILDILGLNNHVY